MSTPDDLRKKLKKLEDRFLDGEVSEETYKEMKARIEACLAAAQEVARGVDNREGAMKANGDIVGGAKTTSYQQHVHYHGSPIRQPAYQLVVCPFCGLRNKPEDTFRCRECGQDHLCRQHLVREARMCEECAASHGVSEAAVLCEWDDLEMILVPDGEFWMGCDGGGDDEKPERSVCLASYYIGKYAVTNAQYRQFVLGTGHPEPDYWADPRFNKPMQPVGSVSWHDAAAFCRWLCQKTKQPYYRLPTEAEWEKAARGDDARDYPWGDQPPNATLCNFNSEVGQPTPVGSYPLGGSPYGCLDMAGNAWEWCLDWYGLYVDGPSADGAGPTMGQKRVLRGGGCYDPPYYSRATCRHSQPPTYKHAVVGFRVARSVG